MGSRMIAAVIVVMLFGAPAFAQGCGAGTCSLQASPAVGMGSLLVEPTIRDIPENCSCGQANTVIGRSEQQSWCPLQRFGPHNMLNFTDIQKIFEVDCRTVLRPSRIRRVLKPQERNRPGDVLLRLP